MRHCHIAMYNSSLRKQSNPVPVDIIEITRTLGDVEESSRHPYSMLTLGPGLQGRE